MKKKIALLLICLYFVLLIPLSSPVRAIKISAVMHGCEIEDVKNANIEKIETINFVTSYYEATNTALCDTLTDSGHFSWNVYHIFFLHIPQWTGNG